jgi:endonuclease III related protein
MMTQANANPALSLKQYYTHLLGELGPQHWWPGRTRLEVILGAILTQNTAWTNAARALQNLRERKLLSLARLREVSQPDLEERIRPAGFFRQKARTIRNFLEWLQEKHRGSLGVMFGRPAATLREELVAVRGLGPETVDAILLYAGRRPFFVADAYTQRILARHTLVPAGISYAELQTFLHRHLPLDPALFNEFHALLVAVGKRWCKRREPRCQDCALRNFLPGATPPAVGAKVDFRSGATAPAAGIALNRVLL